MKHEINLYRCITRIVVKFTMEFKYNLNIRNLFKIPYFLKEGIYF